MKKDFIAITDYSADELLELLNLAIELKPGILREIILLFSREKS